MVLVEQVGAVDVSRLGDLVGRLTPQEQWGVDTALAIVLGAALIDTADALKRLPLTHTPTLPTP